MPELLLYVAYLALYGMARGTHSQAGCIVSLAALGTLLAAVALLIGGIVIELRQGDASDLLLGSLVAGVSFIGLGFAAGILKLCDDWRHQKPSS